ncbi:hypothetical protein DOM22_15795 [Bdellovibrio sp. ZAP7]|uniref:hypothetical protein n=1 Tax=Bdellovibrio sp. ZAP7 TaxID=2231053 RepID=UPI00115A50F1|nr:hypothetical protein [Bdellovibrio sp. ZAP7]QDK46525.1 hypothetical protein DOM22_15795 [Bdellovibrio sp. ZAP7]
MKKKVIYGAVCTLAVFASIAYLIDDFQSDSNPRFPASTPENYKALSACEKQEVLWKQIQESAYKQLPDYKALGLTQIIGMGRQEVAIKGSRFDDFAPKGWTKFLHARASITKVKIVPHQNKYSGLFQGADCGLLRLSLTSAVKSGRPVAPGLALKLLRDGTFSTNVSALVSLDGQDQDYNFFKYPMSNIVPIGTSIGQKLVHKIFLNASPYPEELAIRGFAELDQKGHLVTDVRSPRQVFFVPSEKLTFSSDPHDVRNDFVTIPVNTVIYQIRAVPEKYKDFNYADYAPENVKRLLQDSELVADVVTTSEFVSSSFGDDGIFFRHQLKHR